MNPKATLLLIKGEIKTSEVISCTPSEDAQSWAVTFASGKTYTYKSSSIELLDSPEQPDPNLYQISRNGKRLFHITAIYISAESRSLSGISAFRTAVSGITARAS